MLEAKPPSSGSGATRVAAAHIHGHRRWAAPLLASLLLSSLLISVSLFFSSSRTLLLSLSPLPSAASAEPLFVEAKLRQQMRAEGERPARGGTMPRIAYLISGSIGDGTTLRRMLRALYHRGNMYVVYLDLEAPAAECGELTVAVRADPFYARFRNVKVVTRANLITYRGLTMVANTLHAAAILMREGGDSDWFINLSAFEYPLVTQDRKRRCDLSACLFQRAAGCDHGKLIKRWPRARQRRWSSACGGKEAEVTSSVAARSSDGVALLVLEKKKGFFDKLCGAQSTWQIKLDRFWHLDL